MQWKKDEMDELSIKRFIENTFQGVTALEDHGNYFFIYDTENRAPFATILTSSKYDTYSDLDRPGIFRLNIGVSRETYRSRFPTDNLPADSGLDFAVSDQILPHPEYGRVYWVCVINPSEETFEEVRPLLSEAYQIAVRKFDAFQKARSQR